MANERYPRRMVGPNSVMQPPLPPIMNRLKAKPMVDREMNTRGMTSGNRSGNSGSSTNRTTGGRSMSSGRGRGR